MTDNRYTQGPRVRVAAVIVRNGEILLAEHLKDGRAYYLLPGGGVDTGETLSDALTRELWEETRLAVTPGRLLFVCESIAPDYSRHIIQIAFAADIEADAMPSKGDDPRVSGAYFFPPEALPDLALFPPAHETLVAGLQRGFPDAPPSLGNCWVTQ